MVVILGVVAVATIKWRAGAKYDANVKIRLREGSESDRAER